jgi:uncharacterized membrane protein YdjX (TVP38/TMEM64 family)
MTMPTRRFALGLAVLAVVAAGALLVSPARAVATARGVAADPVLFGAVLLALYVVRPVFAWPGTLLSLAVGYGYGFPWGVPIALVGVTATTLPTFYAARWFGRDTALTRVRTAGERFFERTGDLRGVTAGRLAPLPADAVTCAAAVSEVSVGAFVAGTLVGELPWTLAAVFVGSSAERLTTSGLGAVGLPLGVGTAVAALVLLAGPASAALTDRFDVAADDA